MQLTSMARSALAVILLGGCAGNRPPETAPPASDDATAASAASATAPDSGDGGVRWRGNLAPTQQRSGGIGPRSQSRTYGTVSLQSVPGESRSRARITISGSTQSTTLPWAILPGQCGTGSLPLMAVNSFPVIEVGSSGRAEFSAELPLTLPTEGNFHVNVYWPGGQQLDEVMTCANLKRS